MEGGRGDGIVRRTDMRHPWRAGHGSRDGYLVGQMRFRIQPESGNKVEFAQIRSASYSVHLDLKGNRGNRNDGPENCVEDVFQNPNTYNSFVL